MTRNQWIALLGLLVALGLAALWLGQERGPAVTPHAPEAPTPARDTTPTDAEVQPHERTSAAADASAPSRGDGVVAEFTWGSGPNSLARSRPQEGNPEAPMSLAVDRAGTTWVVDQVNGRLVAIDAQGRRRAVPLPVQEAQDITTSRDGRVLVMDRLVDKAVAVLGPDGATQGELGLVGKGLREGGAATGVFVDGDDVYVEREHGDLVRVGSTAGAADSERPEVPGRPSRDGKLYLSAALGDRATGAVLVTAIDRPSKAHRYTRQLTRGSRALQVTLLDTDASGIIYLGLVRQVPGTSPEAPRWLQEVLCLEPNAGALVGRIELPVNEGPEETFRELAVPDEGGVLFLQRTEAGATLLRAQCG